MRTYWHIGQIVRHKVGAEHVALLHRGPQLSGGRVPAHAVGVAHSGRELAPVAIGDAIGLAVKRLRQRPTDSRVLVLITDGANNGGEIEPKVAARLAAEQKVKIYTIGIGSDPQQSGIMGMLGLNPGVDLDEATLIDIAEQTGGAYFRARTSEELQRIEETLDQLEPAAQLPTRARPAKALYPWPLAAALLVSLLLVARELWPQRWQALNARIGGRS